MALDDLDRRILVALQEDARRSYRQLATLCGSTVPTISSRIRRMEDLGIILGYGVRLNPASFGAASDEQHVNVEASAAVVCHECGQDTAEPIEASLGGRKHAFCCPTCRRLFEERFNRMRQS